MRRVGFILKNDSEESRILVKELVPWLLEMGHQAVVLKEDVLPTEGAVEVDEEFFHSSIDLVVALGGDGTMLRASKILGDTATPVLGINLGRLGFLAPFDPEQATAAITAALADELPTTERMRLEVTFRPRDGEAVTRTALNDAVIHQGAMARLIELNAYLDDMFIASYRADGLIVSTATGSTAYNLAAGGPILLPGQHSISLTPICAHALTMRPLVLSGSRTIAVELGEDSKGVLLTVDGGWVQSVEPGDRIELTAAATPLTVFRSPEKGYFDILRKKLHWGVRPLLRPQRTKGN